MQAIEIGNHWLAHFGPLQVHMDTVLTAWIAMFILIIFALLVRVRLQRIPGKLQAFAEMVLEFTQGIATDQIGKEGYKHAPLIASLFLFILISNLLGQLPWRLIHLSEGELAAPTNDLNTTVALALIVVVYYVSAGISKKGFKYFKHYVEPYFFLLPLNMLEDITRPLTLSLRLFGNILAGEIMIMVIAGLVPKFFFFAPLPLMLFELFVALIQAYIFAILSASYIGAMVSEEH